MYRPEEFEEADMAVIRDVCLAYPLATIVAQSAEGLLANHIPLLWLDDDRLFGHIARENTLHSVITPGTEVLAIFHGENGYISANWYPTKQEHHRQVPTWNYQSVHIYGTMTFQYDQKSKALAVGKLTKYFEILTNGDQGWRMSDAPGDFIQEELDNIVAFKIQVKRVQAVSKLSQNKVAKDFENVVSKLNQCGQAVLAQTMRQRRL